MGAGSLGGGAGQNQFIGLAMAQASKLFDEKNNNGHLVRLLLLLLIYVKRARARVKRKRLIYIAELRRGQAERRHHGGQDGVEDVLAESGWQWRAAE